MPNGGTNPRKLSARLAIAILFTRAVDGKGGAGAELEAGCELRLGLPGVGSGARGFAHCQQYLRPVAFSCPQ